MGFLVGLWLTSTAWAQSVTPTSRLAWDQQAATVAEAQALTYRYFADGGTTGVSVTGVTCTGPTAPFVCQVPFPAFTPGAHTIRLTAGNTAGESALSAALSFVFVVIPTPPANLRIQ